MADDFCKFFDAMMAKYTIKEQKKREYHRNGTLSKAEVMVIMILFHNSGYRCLKHFYLGKPICILDLKDERAMQMFDLEKFGPFGYNDANKSAWRLRFEIVDVYPGTKYQDTAISELEFDGIDVH